MTKIVIQVMKNMFPKKAQRSEEVKYDENYVVDAWTSIDDEPLVKLGY